MCAHCGEKVYPEEELKCSRCDKPKRGTLLDCYIRVERIDSSNYAFYPDVYEPLREEHQELNTLNLDEIYKKKTSTEQANLLGVDNPFAVRQETTQDSGEDIPF